MGHGSIGHMPRDLAAAVGAYRQAQEAIAGAQDDARQLVADARAAAEQARRDLAEAIVDAAKAGMRQKDIVEATGYTRETVRRILRAAGIDADSD